MNPCGPRADFLKTLHEKYGEELHAIAEVNETAILEVLVSPTGTWTIMASGKDGNSCLLSAGTNWTSLPPPRVTDPAKPTDPDARPAEPTKD